VTLTNDSASPGNSMLYGTNSSGVRGWYAQSGGNAITGLTGDVSATGPGNVQATIQSAAVNQSKLKTSTGTWSINVPASSGSSTNLVDYCFFPKQAPNDSSTELQLWAPLDPSSTTQSFYIGANNLDASNAHTWVGTYRYVSSSEQKIEVYRDSTSKIVAIHVTETVNPSPTIQIFDKNNKPIPLVCTIMNIGTNPTMFDSNKLSLYDATTLIGMLN